MRIFRGQRDISGAVFAVFRMAEFVFSPAGLVGSLCHFPGFWSGVAVLSLSGYPVLSTLLATSCVPRTVYVLGRGAGASLWVERGKGS